MKKNKIPKIIHYCWFGQNEMPAEYSAYIDEWKHMHPGWQFIRWNEDNAPMDIPYLKNAQVAGNWANMSNYTRLYAVKKYGGIYLDTDMKLIKELTPLLGDQCFFGFEEDDRTNKVGWVNNAIFGAVPDDSFISSCHDELLARFDGKEEANLSAPRLITEMLISQKDLLEYKEQVLGGVKLYPVEYFYPIHYSKAYLLGDFEAHISPETIAVHMWARTWFNKKALIDTIDFLNYKTAHQQEVIDNQVETIKDLNKKADEIYFWKQHFENEVTQIKAAYEEGFMLSEQKRLEAFFEKMEMKINSLQQQFLDIDSARFAEQKKSIGKEMKSLDESMNTRGAELKRSGEEIIDLLCKEQDQFSGIAGKIDDARTGNETLLKNITDLIKEYSSRFTEIKTQIGQWTIGQEQQNAGLKKTITEQHTGVLGSLQEKSDAILSAINKTTAMSETISKQLTIIEGQRLALDKLNIELNENKTLNTGLSKTIEELSATIGSLKQEINELQTRIATMSFRTFVSNKLFKKNNHKTP